MNRNLIMNVFSFDLTVKTTSDTDIIDITPETVNFVKETGVKNGTVILFIPGSTASLTTIEYESGAVLDLKKAIENIAPLEGCYRHNERWHDGNGYSHVRAALLGPSLCIPIINSSLVLGTWQQTVLCDFDNRGRTRKIIVQIIGV